MRPYTDEELVAYADGELPAAQMEAIAQAAKVDAGVAARIKAFQDTRKLLKAAFAPRAAEPVPQRLLDAIQGPSAASVAAGNDAASGNVVPFARRRETAAPRWKVYVPMAAAALVVLGVGLNANRLLGPRASGGGETAIANQNLINVALETSPSGVPVTADGQEVLPLSTLRTETGTWCREFEARAGAGELLHKSRGIACRAGENRWELRVLAAAPQVASAPADSGYKTASGDAGPDLSNTIGKASALTPAQEQEKLQQHWE